MGAVNNECGRKAGLGPCDDRSISGSVAVAAIVPTFRFSPYDFY